MAKVFVIGATGETGRRTCLQLRQRAIQDKALHRNPKQAQFLHEMDVEETLGDLVSISVVELAEWMVGCDTIVFTAGANGGGTELTDAVDGKGLEKAAAAALIAGAKHFILVSAFPDAWRDRKMPLDFEHYMFVKRQADVYLSHTDLKWVILRPGTLENTEGTGLVRTGLTIPYGSVSRDDVAAVICELIARPFISRVIIELTEGSTPVGNCLDNF